MVIQPAPGHGVERALHDGDERFFTRTDALRGEVECRGMYPLRPGAETAVVLVELGQESIGQPRVDAGVRRGAGRHDGMRRGRGAARGEFLALRRERVGDARQ